MLIISFENLSEPGFLLKVTEISTSVLNNVSYPMPWPAQVVDPVALGAKVAKYHTLYKAAAHGDRVQIKARNDERALIMADLKTVAHYLEIVTPGNAAALATTGFDLRHPIVVSNNPEPLGALLHLRVTRTALGGGLLVHARAEPRADVYNVQIASADPSVEANWADAGNHPHCNRIELTGLTPGKTYYVRIRGFNKNGHGVWTTSAGTVVM